MADINTNIQQGGNDILAYRGDAALAGGYQGGIPEGIGADSLNTFNRSLENMFRQNNEWNTRIYLQKLKDRDDAMAAVSQNVIDIDVLDEDRPVLEDQIKKIEAIRLKTPDIMSDPKEWNSLQSEIKKFTDMKNSAKTRSVLLRNMAKEMADNPDARYRSNLQNHIQSEINKGVLHIPSPYQKLQDWGPELFGGSAAQVKGKAGTPGQVVQNAMFQVKQLPGSNRPVVQDGLYFKEQVSGSDLADWDQYYSAANFVEGENKNLPDQALAFYRFAQQDPQLMSDENLNAINSKLDAINKANNIQPNDHRYLQPIATRNPNGQGWQIDSNPVDFVKKISLFKDYRLPTRQLIPDKDLQTMSSTKAQEALRRAQASTERSKQALNAARANAQNKLANLYDAKAASEKAGDISAIGVETLSAFEDMSKNGKFESVGKVLNRVQPTAGANVALMNLRRDLDLPENTQIAEISKSNQGAAKMVGQPKYNKANKYIGFETPVKMYAIKVPGKPMQLAGITADGTVKIVDRNTGAAELIKHMQKFNSNAQSVKLYDTAVEYMQEIGGDDDSEAVEETSVETVASPSTGIAQRISTGDYEEAIQEGGQTYYRIGESFYDAKGNEITE